MLPAGLIWDHRLALLSVPEHFEFSFQRESDLIACWQLQPRHAEFVASTNRLDLWQREYDANQSLPATADYVAASPHGLQTNPNRPS